MFEITLDDLVKTNPQLSAILKRGRLELIRKTIKEKFNSINQFAKHINSPIWLISQLLNERSNPNIILLDKISKALEIKTCDLIEKIIVHGRPSGSFIHVDSLPIKETSELASLVGHAFGDGHLSSPFSFTNKSQALIDDVIKKVNSLPIKHITSSKQFHKVNMIFFSSLVKDILVTFGAPVGNKTKTNISIPLWIKEGSIEIKKAFLQALFDDESTVSGRQISIGLSKCIELEEDLDKFLLDLKTLLNKFGIEGTSISKIRAVKKGKNGITIWKSLTVNGILNAIKFRDTIGFVHPIKSERLERLIQITKKIKMNKGVRKTQVLELLKQQGCVDEDLMVKTIDISREATMSLLRKLEKEKFVIREKHFNENNSRWSFKLII